MSPAEIGPGIIAHQSGNPSTVLNLWVHLLGRTKLTILLNFKRAIIRVLMRAPAQLFLFKCYHHITKLTVPAAIAQTRFGGKLYCDPKDFIQSMIYHFGIWEPNVSWVIQQLLSDGDVVADIGANIGYDSLLSSKAVGESGGYGMLIGPHSTAKQREQFATLTRSVRLGQTGD